MVEAVSPSGLAAAAGFLSRERLERLIADQGVVGPPEPAAPFLVKESHVELRLGAEAFVTREKVPVQLTDEEPFLTIPSGEFALLTTYEHVAIPSDILGLISIKFRFKILGLLNVSGFHVDPGYRGKIVFSVYNLGPSDVVLKYKDPIFLLFLAPLTAPVPNARVSGDERFQNQRGLPLDYVMTLKGTSLSLTTLSNRVSQLETTLKIAAALLLPILAVLVTVIIRVLFRG